MKYTIIEQEYHYIPTPEDADYTFDPVVWDKEEIEQSDSLPDILERMKKFTETWDSVDMSTLDGGDISLNSGSDRENPDHPAYYYTPRHELRVYKEDISGGKNYA